MINNIFSTNTSELNPEINKYLDNRLKQWALWHTMKEENALGYRKKTNEKKLMDLGTVVQESKYPKPLPSNPSAEEVEKVIVMMKKQGSQTEKYAEAMREYYLKSGENKRKASRILGVAEGQFYVLFNGALTWLNGWFTGKHGYNYYKLLTNS